MTDWTSGYVSDIVYTYGYYSELNPLRAKLALLNKGVHVPEFATACELGFGQGLSTNVHAAASATRWWGTDFNPAQAGFARDLAARAGTQAQLFDQSFEEFANRPDLPDFDFIGLHGIWSWISDENRRVIVDFIRRKLKVGGVVYVSYNTQPGWGPLAPLRHFMTEHAAQLSGPGQPLVSRIDQALAFTERMLDTNPMLARVNPQMVERFKKLQGQNRHYLAHEYFNRDWQPMYFSDAQQLLEAGKVQFAASAHLLDHLDPLNFSADQMKLLADIRDPSFRETVRDFLVNQQFRRDFWVKGVRPMTAVERLSALRACRVVLVTPAATLPQQVQGMVGTASINAAVHGLFQEKLADHQPHSLGELEAAGASRGVKLANIIDTLMIAAGIGHVALAQDDDTFNRVLPTVGKLNAALIERSAGTADIASLASARTGGAISLGRFQQLFLGHSKDGVLDAATLAARVWATVSEHGQRLVRNGETLNEPQDNLAELETQATAFLKETLPLCKALGVAVA
jgi:SAM-dependent methyltransferase